MHCARRGAHDGRGAGGLPRHPPTRGRTGSGLAGGKPPGCGNHRALPSDGIAHPELVLQAANAATFAARPEEGAALRSALADAFSPSRVAQLMRVTNAWRIDVNDFWIVAELRHTSSPARPTTTPGQATTPQVASTDLEVVVTVGDFDLDQVTRVVARVPRGSLRYGAWSAAGDRRPGAEPDASTEQVTAGEPEPDIPTQEVLRSCTHRSCTRERTRPP